MTKTKLLFLFIGLTIHYFSQAQGCSDAGFCSLKYHSTQGADSSRSYKNSIALGNVIGIGDDNTFVNGNWISYNRQLSPRLFSELKLGSNYASGDYGSNFNLSDITATLSWQAYSNQNKKTAVQLLAGLKIPLTDGNDKDGAVSLPMGYQSSLGTWDLLAGGLLNIKNWEFTHAWQIPLTQQNENTFFKAPLSNTEFSSTNQFNRKSDALLRVAYSFRDIKPWLSLKPNLLAIYHVAEDSYENLLGKRETLVGSQGLTLNANLIASFKLNKRSALDLSLATPLVVRDIRSDGLTRKFTASVEYKFSF